VKFDFARWIASELRAQFANWTLVLLRNKPSDHNNQHNCPLLASRKPATLVRVQTASLRAARRAEWQTSVSQIQFSLDEASWIANYFSV
jgi:hypothetical protein